MPTIISRKALIDTVKALNALEKNKPLQEKIRRITKDQNTFDTIYNLTKMLQAAIFLDIHPLKHAITQVIASDFPEKICHYFSCDEQHAIVWCLLESIHKNPVLNGLLKYFQIKSCNHDKQRLAECSLRSIDLWPFTEQRTILHSLNRCLDLSYRASVAQEHNYRYVQPPMSRDNTFNIEYIQKIAKKLTQNNFFTLWHLIRHYLQSRVPPEAHLPEITECQSTVIENWLNKPCNQPHLTIIDSFSCPHYNLLTISPMIRHFQTIKTINLDNNILTTLPDELYSLSSLKKLFLNHNCLTTISDKIGNLSTLKHLEIEHNMLYSLPNTIGLLQKLSSLKLNDNKLMDIPLTIADLHWCLKSLDLINNEFEEEVLIELSMLLPHTHITY